MTNELTDVRCPCGTEFPAESYDAGFIAGSGMCQNCDAALPPKDICTCPSGDGSLRHPCPAHPAIEQAGGDERAVDGKPRATKCPDCGDGDLMPGDLCACGYETDPAAGYACSECDGSGDGYVGEVCRECDGSGWFVTPEQARAALAIASSAQAEHERDMLGQALGECIEAAGITTPGTPLTGPQLLMFAKDLKRDLKRAALAQPSPAPTASGYDQLWAWFGLSRCAYAVLPRVMMHAMPDDWQRRFAELMDEWDDHWPNQPDITAHVQIKQNNRFISTPPWLLNYRHPDHNQLNAMRGKGEL
ncbi:hypothetical protein [Pseudomonas aeruginosa]|uniref:hypothetical protein n=1 Tax=Pseudomonas aeruginosa TaxID=287 RepID=UPI001EECF4F8|nr:hypothetical protein [Pseudomonas aeruginosa]MCG7114982.1 hypothetical protein [Pseudomonas aeruginosa]